MATRRAKALPAPSQVEPPGSLTIHCVTVTYNRQYEPDVVFDGAVLHFRPASWIWRMLESLAAESVVVRVLSQGVLTLKAAIEQMAADPTAHEILDRLPKDVGPADFRRLFRWAEEVARLQGDSAAEGRRRYAFRTFVLSRATSLPFPEPVDAQTVRFRPTLPTPRSTPRSLISDFNDIADPKASLPVGALPATSARELAQSVKTRAEYDLQKIRNACIADMNCAAEVRVRARELRGKRLPSGAEEVARHALQDARQGKRIIDSTDLTPEQILGAVLRVVERDGLSTAEAPYTYSVPRKDELQQILFRGRPAFQSLRIFEIEHRACAEEVFAAFHLLHTYVGWNWSSVMSLGDDQFDFSNPGFVELQSYKSKTDDDTPNISIDLSEPGVEMAIGVLFWNRARLVESGFLAENNHSLWAIRPARRSLQEPHQFHPAARLRDFIERHGLPRYSLDQVRSQYLFHLSLTKGGIEKARLHGGHVDYGTTQIYVGNVVQDRISSALNLEFSKRLEGEIIFLYDGGSRFDPSIKLLKPIGDGASCVDPQHPPAGRSQQAGNCEARACHSDGGCPHRRIVIDDLRIEEVVRFHRHYTSTWQRAWQENPERYVVHVLPSLTFNAALLQALRNGPYAVRLRQIEQQVDRA